MKKKNVKNCYFLCQITDNSNYGFFYKSAGFCFVKVFKNPVVARKQKKTYVLSEYKKP